MGEKRIIEVKCDFDIINARMQVREIARAEGFDIMEQASISLATSSLAYALGLGGIHPGQVAIDCLSDGKGRGVRVIFTRANATADAPLPKKFGDTVRMVDEMTVETLSSGEVKVTVIKWDEKRN